MTVIYKPVLIDSAEQAEALPVGTVATVTGGADAAVRVAFGNGWSVSGDELTDASEHMIGWTALVPIEAEEETSVVVRASGFRDIAAHPYSEASMDPDGNVWFGEGLSRVDVTEQFNEWAKRHTRTRLVTPWEEA